MIIHSVIPVEKIFEGYQAGGGVLQEVSVGGRMLLVEEIAPRQYQLVRLINGSLEDYLHPALQPGTRIPASWVESDP
ncbi:YlzJ-like family protein [Rubeoparvulum massiliense]|uniref:YlzJ-like family protein n=1 Tax=Rubeoparvulum massiliense TaxID=1631346 RepID=UPI00065E58AF|nr:YlzJ-like family protein [Rubeoparvulum massiliense]